MRKRIMDERARAEAAADRVWMDLETLARVELTSEEPAFPIESALIPDDGSGWRSADTGPQMIRLVFDEPQRLQHIMLAFQETEYQRTQEFVLRWSGDGGRSYRELVRQQYNFAPPANSREVEEYTVSLDGVTALELDIVPDIARSGAKASLEKLLIA